jgi:hypothetical protein
MNSKTINSTDRRERPLLTPAMTLGIVLFGLTCFGIRHLQAPKPVDNNSEGAAPVTASSDPVLTAPAARLGRHRPSATEQLPRAVKQREVQAQPQAAGSTAYAQQLLATLTQIDPNGLASPQKMEELKQAFKQLAAQGAAAVPAIGEYLDRFQDRDFDSAARKRVGYPSLRIGLMDVLAQSGSPEASGLLLQTLQNTGDSQEIAFLAKRLENQIPLEQVRSAALTAASEVLTQALSDRRDMGESAPLFEVLQKYGDASVVGLLEQSVSKWKYYPTLALAGMADGAGIPSLIQLAQDPAVKAAGNGDLALRPLAQVALQYPEARAALLEQARLNQIPDRAWPTVASSLAGTYIQYGNQIFGSTVPPVVWSGEQINARLAMLDQMLAVTSNSAGHQALQKARAMVLR